VEKIHHLNANGHSAMRNIGSVSRRWLAEIDILTQTDLEKVGAVAAWTHLKSRYPKQVTKNLLWALIGAELDMDWREIPEELKQKALVETGSTMKNA
jgi:DNA transformation protein and related proteins